MKPSLYSLLPRPPHPTRDGLAIRNYQLLQALAGEFRVRAFALRPPAGGDGEYPAGVDAREIPHGGLRRAAAIVGSLAGGASYSERLYRSTRLARAIAAGIEEERPAWVLAHGYQLGSLAARAGAPAWVDFHNVDSEIWERLARTSKSPAARFFARLQAPRVRRLERAVAREAAGLSCVSERDARALVDGAPGIAPFVVPNGVDLARYSFRAEPSSEKLLFFVGDLSWPPNSDGVLWFRDRVWPRISERDPEACVEILGRGAPRSLRVGGDRRFRVIGEGGDTRPHWRRAALAVVPLRAGGGTRLKILEAAASGVPVVSTPIGAEGLDFEPGGEIELAEKPEEFADRVVRLLGDPDSRRRLAAAARRKVEARYDWRRIGERFARELRVRAGSK